MYSSRSVLLDDGRVEKLPGTKQAGGQKLISFDEVQKHNKRNDCWVIIDVSGRFGSGSAEDSVGTQTRRLIRRAMSTMSPTLSSRTREERTLSLPTRARMRRE